MDRLGELAAFSAAVEEGSFSAAARRLDLTPSAVSKLIQRLESRLGTRLFHRTSRSLHLTQEGDTYYRRARSVLDEMAEADNSISTKAGRVRGVHRVHMMLTFAKYQLAHRMPEFLARHPSLRVEFILGTEPVNLVEQGIDIAIQSGEPRNRSLYRRTRRFGEMDHLRGAFLPGTARRAAPSGGAALAQLLDFTFRTAWNAWPLRSGGATLVVDPRGNAGSNQGEMLLELARAGIGIVRHAEFHIGDDIRAGRLVPLLSAFHDGAEEALYAVYLHRRNLSPRVTVFLKFLQDNFGAVPPWASAGKGVG